MAKKRHDTSLYTPFGLLLDELLAKKSMSFRRLAIESGMSATSQMSIIRACRGESVPQRGHILAWARVLEATPEQRKRLLDAFDYDDDLRQAYEEALERIAELERKLEGL
ncbi:MAG TPA: hypothetical protein VGF67_16250 [Ktedonobacteraceae bacterium]|jgi:transcriptional regulator with XRE-family HTH domain